MVVVDFFATWCPPCRAIAPFLDELAKAFDGKCVFIKVTNLNAADYSINSRNSYYVKVDVDELSDVAECQGIEAMPTFQFFKNGIKVKEMQGANQDKLRQLVTDNI